MSDSTIPTDPQPDPADSRPTLSQQRRWVEESGTGSVHTGAIPATQPPVVARELMALLLIIVVCDLTIYRGSGYTGLGVLLAVAPLLLLMGIVPRAFDRSSWVLAPLLVLTSIRLVWCGSTAAAVAGFVLLCGYAMALSGLRPHVIEGIVFAAQRIAAGYQGLQLYSRALNRISPNFLLANWISVLMPVVTLVVFSIVFILANPDLVKSFGTGLNLLIEALQQWLIHIQPTEILFCIGIGWIAIGMLRPDVKRVDTPRDPGSVSVEPTKSPLYAAFRNTLVMVIGLFAVYLVFEFQTQWFRVFPKGYHYSGYAHEGAAWLTVALGLATLLLSIIFRGRILNDPRLARLRLLSWIWSAENLLLAIAVFNRLFIYVGFNGMTRMRVIGLLGVASVVGGFLLVLRKIARHHDFVWLIRHQLWTVTFAAYLYAVLPVDAFVNEYNVRRILAGDPAPSVQISVHPTSAEGYLRLEPLIHCDDPVIRKGIRAILSQKLSTARLDATKRRELGWTAYQLAEDRLLEQLQGASPQWENDENASDLGPALEAFRLYAYQWY